MDFPINFCINSFQLCFLKSLLLSQITILYLYVHYDGVVINRNDYIKLELTGNYEWIPW